MNRTFVVNMVLLALLGAMLFIGGRALGGHTSVYWDSGRVHVYANESSDFKVTEQLSFTELEVATSFGDVHVVSGRTFGIEGKYTSGTELEYEVVGGVLRVYDNGADEGKRFNVGIMVHVENRVTITIPDSIRLDRVDLRTQLGEVYVEGINAVSIAIKSNMGDVGLRRVTCDELSADVDIGGVNLRDITVANRTSIKAATGEIEATGTYTGEVEMTTDIGDIDIKTDIERSAYTVDAKSELGSVRILPGRDEKAENNGPNRMVLRVDVGGIRCRFKGQ